MNALLRLGVNIDHVATLRNARGGKHPCPIKAAESAAEAGADGITAHLREDRRHIRDEDIARLKAEIALPLNLEMAATDEMLAIALQTQPNACCLVPEKRAELTTEGGLNVSGQVPMLRKFIAPLKTAGIRVSLFIDPEETQIEASIACGADIVELHTGRYAETQGVEQRKEVARLTMAARKAASFGLEVHAGHGLNYANVSEVAALPEIVELNIGHFLIGESVFLGLTEAIQTMRAKMQCARVQGA